MKGVRCIPSAGVNGVVLKERRVGPANRDSKGMTSRRGGVAEQQENACFYMHWEYGNRKDKNIGHSLMDTHCVSRDPSIVCQNFRNACSIIKS